MSRVLYKGAAQLKVNGKLLTASNVDFSTVSMEYKHRRPTPEGKKKKRDRLLVPDGAVFRYNNSSVRWEFKVPESPKMPPLSVSTFAMFGLNAQVTTAWNGDGVVICASATVMDRDGRGHIPLAHNEVVKREAWDAMTDDEKAWRIRETLRFLVLHELDEHIRVAGALAFDPHKTTPPAN